MVAKKYVLFGAGAMGRATAHDLLAHDPDCKVTLVDRDSRNLALATQSLPLGRAFPLQRDLAKISDADLYWLARDSSVCIGASRYDLNLRCTNAAVEAKAHSIDLGGNTATVEAQFALHDRAVASGVAILPDCGIAPGAVSVLARYCIDRVPDAEWVDIRVGGLPQQPKPPLEYALAFSAHGLLANYAEPSEIIRDGQLLKIPSLTERERCHFPQLGKNHRLEALCTSDGLATLAKTYAGVIPNITYKTLRYEGHWERIKVLHELGLFNDVRKHEVNGVHLTARDFMAAFMNDTLDHDVPDYLVLRVSALRKGTPGQLRTGLVLDMIDRKDMTLGHSAMQRTTGYSAAICAAMLANGEIKERGALKHEVHVPPMRFMDEWAKRGLILTHYDKLP